MPGEIKRLEIFGAGSWKPGNGNVVTIAESDLDDIVANFDALNGTNIVKPHLKLGHTEAQKWFGQSVGIPTLGWIDRVWREGKKLFADISHVPDALLGMIRTGRYHNVSAEVFPPGVIEHAGRKFGSVLSAVAILGTEMPAVKDLAGLASALYADQFTAKTEAAPIIFSHEVNQSMFTQDQVDSLIAAAVDKAVKEHKESTTATFSDLDAQLKMATSRAEAAETKLAEQASTFAAAEMNRLVDEAIRAGRLLPKQRDTVLAFGATMKGTVNFGGAEKPATDLFKEFLNSFGTQVELKERGGGQHAQHETANFATAAQEVDHLAHAAITASNGAVKYSEAVRSVLRENADLADRYAKGV
jgi:hypothetical protein